MAGAVPRTEGGPPLLEVSALRKRFGAVEAVAEVSFTVAEGEILALVGPSGCGKSTTLRMIAGFEAPDGGAIELTGRRVDTLAPERRGIGIVFQDYALFPHLTVLGNVGFAFGNKPRRDHAAEAAPFLDMVGLSGFESRFPDELSGGQQQRVALARTFAARPRLILLDEPFSNLDATLRAATRREIRTLLKRSGVGAVFVTHDQEEALSIADRICVMHRGRVEQVGDPISVYRAPRTAFVAGFLGRTNLVRVPVANGRAATPLGPVEIETSHEGNLVLSIRPEQIRLRRVGEGIAATVVEREFKGRETTYWIGIGAERYQVDTGTGEWFAPGEEVQASVRSPATVVLD